MPRSADDRRVANRRGALAEERVASLLEGHGWQVLSRNWRGGGGELDIVVVRDGCLRIVEVKLRDPDDPVGLEAIGELKRRRLVSAARAWLVQYDDLIEEVAFMVAFVEGDQVTLIDDAFDR